MTIENKEKEKYLSGYIIAINTIKRMKRQRDNISEQIEELRRINCTPATQKITGMPTVHCDKDLSDYMAKIDEFEREVQEFNILMDKKRVEAAKTCTRIWQSIEAIEKEEYKDVLSDHYVLRMSWIDIAKKYGYSRAGIYKLRNKAIEAFNINF